MAAHLRPCRPGWTRPWPRQLSSASLSSRVMTSAAVAVAAAFSSPSRSTCEHAGRTSCTTHPTRRLLGDWGCSVCKRADGDIGVWGRTRGSKSGSSNSSPPQSSSSSAAAQPPGQQQGHERHPVKQQMRCAASAPAPTSLRSLWALMRAISASRMYSGSSSSPSMRLCLHNASHQHLS